MIGLVRESGGYGDIVCCGAAARAIKREHPEEAVFLFVPEEFADTADHLEGVDKVISLGHLKDIQPHRRQRDSVLNCLKYPYLNATLQFPDAHLIDLYCPGYSFENSCSSHLRYNRCQLFAMATGAKITQDARPVWKILPKEIEAGQRWRVQHDLPPEHDTPRLIGVQLRGTCAARCIPDNMKEPLVQALSEFGRVVIFDCVRLPFEPPSDCIQCIGLPVPAVAAILKQCAVNVTVDSFLWHLAGALDVPTVGVFGPTDGIGAAQTYPQHVALDGESSSCALPCNYNNDKGWDQKCREAGCSRMKAHTVERIMNAVRELLRSEHA